MKLSAADILMTIANADWREFEASDYASFAGVSADDKPIIAEDEELETIFVLSGDTFSIIGPSGTEYSYHLGVYSSEQIG